MAHENVANLGSKEGFKPPEVSAAANNNSDADVVKLPTDVYCSLVRCAVGNAGIGFASPLINKKNEISDETLKTVVNSLAGISTLTAKSPRPTDASNACNGPKDESQGVEIPNPPKESVGILSGDLKDSIDQLKKDVFDHYAIFHNLQEYDIGTRLEILSQHHLAQEPEAEGDNATPPTVSKGIMEMLETIKQKFEIANSRINALDDALALEVGDPTLRQWEYSKESLDLMGKPDIDTNSEMCEHIRNLYTHLYQQANINNMKIKALQNKLATLQAHAKVQSRRPPGDTRVAL